MGYEHQSLETGIASQIAHAVMEAIVRGDAKIAGEAFHPDATITGQQDGILVRCDVQAYMEYCRRLRLPRRGVNLRYQIEWADVSGPIGALKLTEIYPHGELTSYMTLSKVNGRWLVNNRTLHAAVQTLSENLVSGSCNDTAKLSGQ